MSGAVERAIRDRLSYLHRELQIAERAAAREPVDASALPANQRIPFDLVTSEIEAARYAVPRIRAEIAELEDAL